MTTLDPLAGPGYPALVALARAVDEDVSVSEGLVELVRLRCSQVNGCAYCQRLHGARAVELGESAERIAALAGWRGSALFDPEERAALELAEAVTLVADGRVPEEVLDAAVAAHGVAGAQQLIWVSLVVNAFNRLAVGMRLA
ncbi:carboxymuconolactone decarboxylase family protein [Actinosynnema pretiosum subsp. pretiosum]|uniref:Carboxymuconolactone decarboxylase family protein n=1 Tax=Actinosynnema pretiosum subsp. pretiosum TaxID=103721 RepID=A0AA45R4M8_9PSEU|nr:4-carboxymuconolactone decarboxylase domain/alkylhydroperoxidase AhpD family core domain protein [Actinosynnema pretiosum subsp. pretiosum]QUF04788.1 carboxymuconolactone decarboxylase family protein [Actinosynnema pretiosum subsp. pretiosum]